MKPRSILRIALLAVLLSAPAVGAEANAQTNKSAQNSAHNQQVVFQKTVLTTGEMIRGIERDTPLRFAFESQSFDTTRVVRLPARALGLNQALTEIVRGTTNQYVIKSGFIVIGEQSPQKPQPAYPAASRTGDAYRPTETGFYEAPAPRRRTQTYEQSVTVQPAPAQTAAYYSAYNDPDLYVHIQNDLPSVALKVNLLYGAATLTPNLGIEIGTGRRTTLEIAGSWNQWNYIGTTDDNRKLNHYIIRPEFRWWFCERFNGHFLGVHAFFSQYNISQHRVPLLFEKKYRYEGNAFGAGVTYGYHWAFARQWGLEFHIGVGLAQLKYKRYDCTLCSDMINNPTKTYFGPTRAGISLVFIIK